MSVLLNNISKIYENEKALDQISFKAEKGEIIGLLGPNGAGKTTTMKILTCFISQNEGEASVCGFDVSKNPIQVRKSIGYLPEHNPLYKEMYVREYLQFIARIFKIKNSSQRIEELIEATGLTTEAHKKIEFLSKGYRQRVGIAQAMMNDPEVLILDEPTSGLDPNQLVDIRALIKKIGEEKLVIFSSHIMQEVQALCNRVIILNKGQIVADDPIELLANRLGGVRKLIVEFKNKMAKEKLLKLSGVSSVELNEGKYEIFYKEENDLREDIFDLAVAESNKLLHVSGEDATVESIFQHITN